MSDLKLRPNSTVGRLGRLAASRRTGAARVLAIVALGGLLATGVLGMAAPAPASAASSAADGPLAHNTGAVGIIDQQFPVDFAIHKTCYGRPLSGPPSDDPDVVMAGGQWICSVTVADDTPHEGQSSGIFADISITDTVASGLTLVASTVASDADSTGATAACSPLPAVGPTSVTCTGIDLPQYGQATFEMAFMVDPAFVATSTYGELPVTNRACIQNIGDVEDVNGDNDCASDTDLVKEEADLAVTKFSEPLDTVQAGQTFTYTILVDNFGPSVARNVVITDTLLSSSNVTIQSCAFSVSQGGGSITQFTCTTGDLVSTQFGTDVGTMRTNSLDPLSPTSQGRLRASFRLVAKGRVDVTDTVRVTAATPDPDMSNNMAVDSISVIEEADLKITKISEPIDIVRAGQTFTYTIFVDNFGPCVSRNVTITDTLLSSSNVSIQSCAFSVSQGGGSITQFTCTTGNLVSTQFGTDIGTMRTNRLDPLSPTSQGRLRASFRLVANGPIDVTNTARVTADTPDPDMSNNMAQDSISVLAVADLQSFSVFGAEVQVNGLPGKIVDTSLLPAMPDPACCNFGGTTVTAGRRIQWDSSLLNNGPSAAENAEIDVLLPFGTSLIENTLTANPTPGNKPGRCATESAGSLRTKVICEYGTLAKGQTASLRFQALVDAALPVGTQLSFDSIAFSDNFEEAPPVLQRRTFTVTGGPDQAVDRPGTFDPDLSNNITSIQFDDNAFADLAITKSALGDVITGYSGTPPVFTKSQVVDQVTAGELLQYTLVVTHKGPSLARNVQVTDDLPGTAGPLAQVAFVKAEAVDGKALACSVDGVTRDIVNCALGDMVPGETRTVRILVRVDPAVANGTVITNSATVASRTTDPYTSDNTATDRTTVNTVADIWVTKVDVPASADLDQPFEPDQAMAGEEHRYLVRFGNNGPSVAVNVGVTDSLDYKQTGILGETFVRCEPIDPDDVVSCSFTAPNTVTVTRLQVANEAVIPTAGTGTLGPSSNFGFYVITKVDSGYVLDGTDLLAADTANIASGTTDYRSQNNHDIHQTLIVAQADLELTKTDIFGTDPDTGFLECDPVAPGGTVTYELWVSNNGPADAAEVFVVDWLPAGLVLDPAVVDVTVSAGQVVEKRDDGRITVMVGNDPNNLGVAQLGRLNVGSTATIVIQTRVAATATCSSVIENRATVETRRDDATWPVAPQPYPGVDGGPRTPTWDPDPTNNEAMEDTTIECPAIAVKKTVSFDGTCPGKDVNPVFNQTAQPVTFCFEITNEGTTYLDSIYLEDSIVTRTEPEPTVVYTDTITYGADPLLPVAPGEVVRRQVDIPHLLRDKAQECGQVTDTVTVTANPVNSGRTDLPCLPDVSASDTVYIEVPCSGVDWRLQLPVVGSKDCTGWIQVQNVGDRDTKAMLMYWGDAGFCPPQASGPLKSECSGLLKPGSSWSFVQGQMPVGARSAMVYSLSAGKAQDERGNEIVFADLVCDLAYYSVVGDAGEWLRFDTAYRGQQAYVTPGHVTLDFGKYQGEPLAASVNRTCPDPTDPNVTVNAAYTGISSDMEGARDPRFGGYTYYAPMLFADQAGLNSELLIQNSGSECSSIEIWFKDQTNCMRSILGDVLSVAPGETVIFDPNTIVGPNWVGSAWIRGSQPLGVVVDTYGANHFTSYSAVAGDVWDLEWSYGNQVSYLPLTYSEYQGWDTAIEVQNLSATYAAKAKVYFLDKSGDVVTTLVDWICPRGSQTFFLPLIDSMPGNWVGSARVESQEWVTPGGPLVDPPRIFAVALMEKWADPQRTARREAVAYSGQSECLLYDWELGAGRGGTASGSAVMAIPLIAKDYNHITTELAITNLVPKPGFTDFAIFLYDQNGLIDYYCQKLNEKQVEYIDLATWGAINPHFMGSAVVSAMFWEHEVWDSAGQLQRNVVGLGGVAVERVGGTQGGPDVPGDESKAFEMFPVYNNFHTTESPNCPGVPPGFTGR